MKTEHEIAKENMIGCNAKVGHREGKIMKKDVWTDRCGKKSFLCYECKRNIKTHKQTCQRFLDFLDSSNIKGNFHTYNCNAIDCKEFRNKITDLKNAIKEYEDNGI